jgi:hypothetical protein
VVGRQAAEVCEDRIYMQCPRAYAHLLLGQLPMALLLQLLFVHDLGTIQQQLLNRVV